MATGLGFQAGWLMLVGWFLSTAVLAVANCCCTGIAKGDMELVDDLVFKAAVLGFSILTRIPPSTVRAQSIAALLML